MNNKSSGFLSKVLTMKTRTGFSNLSNSVNFVYPTLFLSSPLRAHTPHPALPAKPTAVKIITPPPVAHTLTTLSLPPHLSTANHTSQVQRHHFHETLKGIFLDIIISFASTITFRQTN